MKTSIVAVASVLVMCGPSWVAAEVQKPDGRGRPFDSVITRHYVMPLPDFERMVELAATEAGIPLGATLDLLAEFKLAYDKRVVPIGEWRFFFTDTLYRMAIPHEVTRRFLDDLSRRNAGPVDAGFLALVRRIDAKGEPIYELGKDPSIQSPRLVERTLPGYTESARQQRVEGMILLQCMVLEDGSITNCEVVRPLGHGLDEAAVLTVQDEWRFEPALRDGTPVKIKTMIELSFKLL